MTMLFLAVVALTLVTVVREQRQVRVQPIRCSRRILFRCMPGTLLVLTLLGPAVAGAHGTVAPEDDPCVQRVGGNLVHFNAYQPQHAATAQYCTDIPGEGDTFLVVDLLDPLLRQLPVGVRLVRGPSDAAEAETVAAWPPAIHSDGVVRGEAQLAKGLYQLIITPEGFSSSSYRLRVQQIDYANVGRTAMGPITLLLLLALLGYELSKSTRLRGWWASGRA